MWFGSSPKEAIVTVMTNSFLPGTAVMIHSFIIHNQWFNGDIIIIHDDSLTQNDQKLISNLFQIKWVPVESALKSRALELCQDFPDFERRLGQFYSLEVFRLNNYRTILFMDSDTFFKGSIEPLFRSNRPFQVCMKSGKYRKPESVSKENPFSIEQFNAGMMVINNSLLEPNLYNTMIERVNTSFFQSFLQKNNKGQWIHAQLTADQLILNSLLHEKAHYVSMRYNYRLGIADVILEKESIRYEDAVVVHFTGQKKPWLLGDALLRTANHPSESVAYIDWLKIYQKIIYKIGVLHQKPEEK